MGQKEADIGESEYRPWVLVMMGLVMMGGV
jgi:hypothetical protein